MIETEGRPGLLIMDGGQLGAKKTVALVYLYQCDFLFAKLKIVPLLWPDGNPAEQGKSGEIPVQTRCCNACCGPETIAVRREGGSWKNASQKTYKSQGGFCVIGRGTS